MAMLFMEVYELSTLTFMFVRNKNEKLGEIYGPNKNKFTLDNIDNNEGIISPEQRDMSDAKAKESINRTDQVHHSNDA